MPGLLVPPGTVSGRGPETLERALSRANVHTLHNGAGEDRSDAQSESGLGRCFGLEPEAAATLPIAALTRAGEAPHDDGPLNDEPLASAVHWLRADPVHLRPDLAGMSMLPTQALDLHIDEARELIDLLNRQVADESFAFEALSADRWYLRSTVPFELQTTPPGEALKQSTERCLPCGSGAARWHGVMNEAQMTLHGAEVNVRRTSRGQIAVNSVWLWGEGTLAPHIKPCIKGPFANVWSDAPLARGLARASGAHAGPLPERFDGHATREAAAGGLLVHTTDLAFEFSHGDTQAWLDAVARFNTITLEPLLALLTDREIDRVSIDPGGAHRFELTASAIKRWWRPRRRWQRWLQSMADARGE